MGLVWIRKKQVTGNQIWNHYGFLSVWLGETLSVINDKSAFLPLFPPTVQFGISSEQWNKCVDQHLEIYIFQLCDTGTKEGWSEYFFKKG